MRNDKRAWALGQDVELAEQMSMGIAYSNISVEDRTGDCAVSRRIRALEKELPGIRGELRRAPTPSMATTDTLQAMEGAYAKHTLPAELSQQHGTACYTPCHTLYSVFRLCNCFLCKPMCNTLCYTRETQKTQRSLVLHGV